MAEDSGPTPRSVALIGASCLVAGWLMASVILPPVASLQSSPPAPEVSPPAAVDSGAPIYTERLRLKMRDAPPAPTPRRNPFTFEQARAPRAEAASPALVPEAAPPSVPRFELAGIATTDTADGPVRTAIISTGGDVVLARIGDQLPDGSQVVSIDEGAVTLDVAGQPQVLRLKP